MTGTYFELLQLNDATFPIGSYAFSWGLETFVQQGIIHDAKSAQEYIQSELKGSFLYSELLPVRLAWEWSSSEEKLRQLDQIYGASRSPFELRDGSRKLGSRFVKTTAAFSEEVLGIHDACPVPGVTLITSYTPEFFPVAYGAYCARRNIPLQEALAAFTYSQFSGRVTTCVKLVPLSQTAGQQILFNLMQTFPKLLEECTELTQEDLCRSAPGIDLRAMQHEFLYSRLYSN